MGDETKAETREERIKRIREECAEEARASTGRRQVAKMIVGRSNRKDGEAYSVGRKRS